MIKSNISHKVFSHLLATSSQLLYNSSIKFFIFCIANVFLTSITGCKKLVDVVPPDNVIVADNVYNSDVTAIAVLNGLYTQISSINYPGTARIPTISMWAGLYADELTLWSNSTNAGQIAYFKNQLSP